MVYDTGERRRDARPHRRGDAARRSPITHDDLPSTGEPRREQLAHWLTSKDNQYFAKSYVNRIWSYLLGVGHHRAGRRHSRRQPADESRAARTA